MSERDPMAGRERPRESVADVQRASRQREQEIERLLSSYREIETEYRAESDRLDREHAGASEARTAAFAARLVPLIDKRRAVETALGAALARHYREQDAAEAPVADGTYAVSVMFPVRKGGVSMEELRVRGYDTVGALLSNVRGTISMEGLHNFGFDTDPLTRVGEVEYAVKDDAGFYFAGKCWVDNSGHIVRTIR